MGENTKTIRMKKIPLTKLSNEDAKTFFLQEKNYCTIKLPKIISFQSLLDKLQSTEYNVKSACNYDNVNCKLYITQVGSFSPRLLQIINPCIYVELVRLITSEKEWIYICNRINHLQHYSIVDCISFPCKKDLCRGVGQPPRIPSIDEELNILTIKQSIAYQYATDLQIVDCFKNLYTHSIGWALDGYKRAKNAKLNIKNWEDKLLGDKIASLIQQSTYGQTNGIPQGSLLMDFIVELVLAYADARISLAIKCFNNHNPHNIIKDFHIIRNQGQYRIFAKTHYDVERLCHIISSSVSGLNFQTNLDNIVITDKITYNAIATELVKATDSPKDNYSIYVNTLLLHKQSIQSPNSLILRNSVISYRMIVEENAYQLNELDLEKTILILIDIAYHNLSIIDIIMPLLGELISYELFSSQREYYYTLVKEKFDAIPNSEYIQIWVQYSGMFVNRAQDFQSKLFQILSTDTNCIWNMEWAEQKVKELLEQTPIVKHDV